MRWRCSRPTPDRSIPRCQFNPLRIEARIGGKNGFDRNSRQPDGHYRLDATNGARLATIDTW
jgi:hypothetical protein